MNMQGLQVVEKAQFYIDGAFKHGNKVTNRLYDNAKRRTPENMNRFEAERIQIMSQFVKEHFDRITSAFPSFDNLPDFYQELTKLYLDIDVLKKDLAAVNWCALQVRKVAQQYHRQALKARSQEFAAKAKAAFFGRFSSLIKQISKNLERLEAARKILRQFPHIKTDVKTVCIAGFPSVGKSTILSKITTAKPEIAAWDFTTKQLNIGYMTHRHQQIQVIDAPGTLHRDHMNDIEKQAHLAMKYLAHLIVFVFDPTSKYDEETQRKLLSSIEEYDKDFIIYVSKTDLLNEEELSAVKKKFPDALTDPLALKAAIAKHAL